MKRSSLLVLIAAALLGSACAPAIQNEPPPGAKARVGDDGAEIDVTAAAIRSYVTRGDYQAWTAKPGVQNGTLNSPHGKVRIFFNRISEDALRQNTQPLPAGSMIVKELYRSDGAALNGYAAMLKYDAADWVWWEAFAANLDSPAAFGKNHSTCVGCHSGGRDFVRAPLP